MTVMTVRSFPGRARAIGRFKTNGPAGYIAATMPLAPLRSTRSAAVADEVAYIAAQ